MKFANTAGKTLNEPKNRFLNLKSGRTQHVNAPFNDANNKWLHRFAVITAMVAVGLILAGATVTSTGSGDAVPDWPLSYGTLAPPMIGGIFYEHSHRLIAMLTGLLIGILAIWLWLKEPRHAVRMLGLAALIAVLIQATLGGLRVLIVSTEPVQDTAVLLTNGASINATRIAISMTHAALAQMIIAIIFVIAMLTSPGWLAKPAQRSPLPEGKFLLKMNIALVALIFGQLIIGAAVRHTGSGLIIPDFPLSFGELIPPFTNLPHNPNAPFPLSESELLLKVGIHFLHRITAILILGFVIFFHYKFKKNNPFESISKTLFWLTVAQIFLGALNIWTGKSVVSTVLHVAVGAMILAACVMLLLWQIRAIRDTARAPFVGGNGRIELTESVAAEEVNIG